MDASKTLPADAEQATLIGRVFDPEHGGPSVAFVRDGRLHDITSSVWSVSSLLERENPADLLGGAPRGQSWDISEVLENTISGRSNGARLLAPIDLQVIKAAGVTFVGSMLERVIEERAGGDAAKADLLREKLGRIIGGAISNVTPGSEAAVEVKKALIDEGLWSQYLEVGIGPDPEIFTKAPVLSAVGSGSKIGVLSRSQWNNPEPELVLVADSRGNVKGATLGNDVNLRDFEGRSALLLGEAKDNNASCSIGPFIRLFDANFTIDDARKTVIQLRIDGTDGFVLDGASSVSEISRPFEELVNAVHGAHHQYPDGFALFTGTMFTPSKDRQEPGHGFTHHEGDTVTISSERLGALVNQVTTAEEAEDWSFGIAQFIAYLAKRGLLKQA